MSPRRIAVNVELDVAGHSIPTAYYDLPDGWDDWKKDDQEALLVEMASDELSGYASAGASVEEVPA